MCIRDRFGPPGSGKSSLIKKLQEIHGSALDLEEIWSLRSRHMYLHYFESMGVTFLGAAGFQPQDFGKNVVKVLLHVPQQEYEARRAERDAVMPEKASQPKHQIEDWVTAYDWDFVVELTGDFAVIAEALVRYATKNDPKMLEEVLYDW